MIQVRANVYANKLADILLKLALIRIRKLLPLGCPTVQLNKRVWRVRSKVAFGRSRPTMMESERQQPAEVRRDHRQEWLAQLTRNV